MGGRYVNNEYGYSVVVPLGLRGNRMGVPAPQHGIDIRLQGRRGWQFGQMPHTMSAHELGTLMAKQIAAVYKLEVMHDTPMRLAELPPRDLILVSADSASQVNYVHLVAAFRAVPNGIGVVYTLGMRAHRSLRDYGVFAREQFSYTS
jgi:hypothetical protein